MLALQFLVAWLTEESAQPADCSWNCHPKIAKRKDFDLLLYVTRDHYRKHGMLRQLQHAEGASPSLQERLTSQATLEPLQGNHKP